MQVARCYASPLERSLRAAQIAAQTVGFTPSIETAITEIQPNEQLAPEVKARVWPLWERSARESHELGPIAWVTHGGVVTLLLTELGMRPSEADKYKRQFDGSNPAPPAGVWRALRPAPAAPWELSLAFVPGDHTAKK